MRRNRNGQSTFELTLTIVAVIAAVAAMSIYMKRSVMGKLRESGDQVGGQFSPLQTSNDYTRTFKGSQADFVSNDGSSGSTGVSQEQNRTGNENVTALSGETLFQ